MNNYRPSNGFQLIPPVVKNLMIINGLFYLASLLLFFKFKIDLVELLGLYDPTSTHFRPYQLITHFFLHSYIGPGGISFAHILSNMFALWMFGSALENYWGPKRFLTYYFVTALGAALLYLGVNGYQIYQMNAAVQAYASHPTAGDFIAFVQQHRDLITPDFAATLQHFYDSWSMNPQDPEAARQSVDVLEGFVTAKKDIPVVGASGAVFGVLLAFGMLFPNTPIIFLFFPIPVKAKYFVILYGAFELFQGLQNSPDDHVAHFAHLGGMLFGFILIKLWNKTNRNSFY